jgi:UDP-N-acetylglucosamine 3-dehydrogenase
MSSPPLGVAVVGAGLMGRLHARVASESDETELVAIVDEAPEAERVARERHVPRLRTVDELLVRSRRPEAAVVSVPTSEHAEVAGSLLDAGVAVLVEKPIADTVEDACALIERAAALDVPLAVGHVERFNPAVRELQRRLEEHALGRVFQVHARRLSPFPTRIGDMGVAHDLATHDLDLMSLLAGNPVRISAEIDRRARASSVSSR